MCDLRYGQWLSSPPSGEEVVITGISGRFPNASNVSQLQHNLFNKIDMTDAPHSRWKVNSPDIPKRIGTINNIDKMDAGFFGLHSRQAHCMDPMARKVLETSIEAIMDAGVSLKELEGTKTGVFIGICYTEMEGVVLKEQFEPQNFAITGHCKAMMANRISYFLKLKGPSTVIDTSCSSSLNALEAAFQHIRGGKCENAIVAGTTLLRHPAFMRTFFHLGVLSLDGVCKVFDESANGYVRSEAVSCVFLQTSKSAKRIYAQIKHIKVNDDGFKNDGITYPSGTMQQSLIETVMKEAKVEPSDFAYFEAHGTGTTVGDPQECKAIDNAIAKRRNKPLLVGSVKSSLGHTEAAAGLCSIIKVLIAFETGYITPNLHFQNPKKKLTGIIEGRIKVVTELTKLDEEDALVGINSFGFGGNNAHLLLRRFSKVKAKTDEISQKILVCVSGRTEKSIVSLIEGIDEKPNRDYIALLHQIFKKEVAGHCFRGYCVVSQNGASLTHCKFYSGRKPALFIYFGRFEKSAKVIQACLLGFPCFVSTLNKLMKKLHNFNPTILSSQKKEPQLISFFIQMGIAKILKKLGIKATYVYGDYLGEIVCAYYKQKIVLEEAVLEVLRIAKHQKEDEKALETHKKILDNKKMLFLNISDATLDNAISLTDNKEDRFLEAMGMLYEAGCDLDISKIYPTIEFPVSRGTPSISSNIKWEWQKNWYTYYFKKPSNLEVCTLKHKFNMSDVNQSFLLGHVINGQNMFPIAAFLKIVWDTLLQNYHNILKDAEPVVFENVQFMKAVILPLNNTLTLEVHIQKSGQFVVLKEETIVVTGGIFVPEDINEHLTDLPPIELHKEVLEHDEIYKELYLRGYNYRGAFKAVAKCNIDASSGLVKWENNWISFLDNLMQIKMLEFDNRSLNFPVSIKKLAIYPDDLSAVTKALCSVSNYKHCNLIKCKGVEILGLKLSRILQKRTSSIPVLQKNIFIPNAAQLSVEESMRVNTQIILEETLETNFKAVEIFDEFTKFEPLLPLVAKALDDIPIVTADLIIDKPTNVNASMTMANVSLRQEGNFLLIIATKILQRPQLLNRAFSTLSPNGFLLSREDKYFETENLEDLSILTEHLVPNEKLILMRKFVPKAKICSFGISSKSFDWLPHLQKSFRQDSCVVIHAKNPEGLLGFVNCLRREQKKVHGVFLMDDAPEFDVDNPFYAKQLDKKLTVNVYKNKSWGTYRHMILDELKKGAKLGPSSTNDERFFCDPKKSYIIIGGLGGFGLELADWLIVRGAKKIILASRNGPRTGYQKRKLQFWKSGAVDLQISTDDATELQGCLDLIQKANQLGPVDAIFNLAILLADALFENQTVTTFQKSLAPKAQITANLDLASRAHCPALKHFVVFSSLSCGRGNAGQTNYGMGNSIMERICEKRKSEGLPGLAIQWGAIGQVGLAAKMQKENKELVIGGTLQQKIASCLEVMDIFLNQNNPIVSSMVVAEKIERSVKTSSPAKAIAFILGIKDLKSVSPYIPFGELGMDSITAIETSQMLENDFEIVLSIREMRDLTFEKMAEIEALVFDQTSKSSAIYNDLDHLEGL